MTDVLTPCAITTLNSEMDNGSGNNFGADSTKPLT